MTLITFGRAGLLASITALVTALNPIAPAQAQYIYGDGYQQAKQGETRLTPNQREKLFRARKAWMKQSYKRRISILERERRCVDKSKAAAEFRQCKLAKKEARRELSADRRAYINPVRRSVGLPALQAPPPSRERKGRGNGRA
ncbi:hypothetical protein [Synechococcus sp. MIT S1220]|uniref:hypothetical protein n=1 Tax=Synechococcus sp. MIT S1220 TaxID=3082549 RepID=UPI0039AF93F9